MVTTLPISSGKLVNLLVPAEARSALAEHAAHLPSLQPSPETLSHLELLATGALSPHSTMLVPSSEKFDIGSEVTLRDRDNRRLAILRVEEIAGDHLTFALGGSLEVLDLPRNPGFPHLRRTPSETQAALAAMNRPAVLALVLRGPIDLETERIAVEEAQRLDAALLIQVERPWNLGPNLRDLAAARAAELVAVEYLDSARTLVNLISPAPHELDQLIQTNFGATHLLEPPGLASGYRPEVQRILDDLEPPSGRRGFCVWFTGLPSSGKSTVADALAIQLAERGRAVTMLDGDVVRTHLSKGLGFTREDRDTNIHRIGFVASEIVHHHGAVICAAVSPYRAARARARQYVDTAAGPGHFVMVYVATPPEICEQRDVKGFYAKARAGSMQGMTGVDDPYEPPEDADLVLETTVLNAGQNARRVLALLEDRGLVPA